MNLNFDLPKFWHVIINPMALRGGSIEYWESISKQLRQNGFTFQQWFTSGKNDALHIAKNLVSEGVIAIVVVGGDGTLNEVVNGIMMCGQLVDNILLAVLPAGTGNDWSRTHHFSGKKSQILSMFTTGKIILHDIGQVKSVNNSVIEDRFFINVAGLGFDAAVVERTHRAKKYRVAKGFVYVKHTLLTLLNYSSLKCTLLLDGQSISKNVFSIAVGICKYNGNGMLPVPMADPTDGLLDVVVIEEMGILRTIGQIPSLFKGTHIRHPKVSHYRVARFETIPESAIMCEVEGEMVGEGSFAIKVASQKLHVLIPSYS